MSSPRIREVEGEAGRDGAADTLIWSLRFLSEQLCHRIHAVDWLFLQVSLKAVKYTVPQYEHFPEAVAEGLNA